MAALVQRVRTTAEIQYTHAFWSKRRCKGEQASEGIASTAHEYIHRSVTFHWPGMDGNMALSQHRKCSNAAIGRENVMVEREHFRFGGLGCVPQDLVYKRSVVEVYGIVEFDNKMSTWQAPWHSQRRSDVFRYW
ncbi:hypothetical protein [Mesorhizobium sp. B2-6-2]|uniref:hypothetical protein n=1 Tax=Mesorhizobium sp. B2-6-2 TaxID=2589915 RepID=UPI001FEE868A|nr:hypothetical protein [Mesorhizobium sp. B2-6-2]